MTTSTYRILNSCDPIQLNDLIFIDREWEVVGLGYPLFPGECVNGRVVCRPQPDRPDQHEYVAYVARLQQTVDKCAAERDGARAQVKVLEKTIDAQKAVNECKAREIERLEAALKQEKFHFQVAQACINHNTTLREQGLVFCTSSEKTEKSGVYRLLANGETLQYGDEVLMVADGKEAKMGEWRCLDHSEARGIVGKPPSDCTFRRPITPPQPAYAELPEGERLRPGDEFQYRGNNAAWVPVGHSVTCGFQPGGNVRRTFEYRFRRKL